MNNTMWQPSVPVPLRRFGRDLLSRAVSLSASVVIPMGVFLNTPVLAVTEADGLGLKVSGRVRGATELSNLKKNYLPEQAKIEVDWSRLKIKFSGLAQPEQEQESFKQIEQRAWSDGLLVAKLGAQELYMKYANDLPSRMVNASTGGGSAAKIRKELGRRVVKYARSLRTEYHGSGSVRVLMESNLAPLLVVRGIPLKKSEKHKMAASVFSGLILRSKSRVTPGPVYRIVDETGKVLYSSANVFEGFYKKNLMGKWFVKPRRRQLIGAVGVKPVSLAFVVDSHGDFVVQGGAWHQATANSKAVLEQARIAIVTGD